SLVGALIPLVRPAASVVKLAAQALKARGVQRYDSGIRRSIHGRTGYLPEAASEPAVCSPSFNRFGAKRGSLSAPWTTGITRAGGCPDEGCPSAAARSERR